MNNNKLGIWKMDLNKRELEHLIAILEWVDVATLCTDRDKIARSNIIEKLKAAKEGLGTKSTGFNITPQDHT
jgi:hypothetical protein